MKIVSIASASLVDPNPVRIKKIHAKRDAFKKLVESYHKVAIKDWWCAMVALYAKWW